MEKTNNGQDYGIVILFEVTLLAGPRTCDSHVAGSRYGGTIAGWPWASYLHLCVSVTKQYNLVLAYGVISLAGKVTACMLESNGSLPPGL